MSESLSPGDVIDQEGSYGALVVGSGDGLESLLTGGVPNLDFDDLAVDFDGLGSELDADGQLVLMSEFVVRELE
jgi:hypothetical protein